jgi:hypothetical protein
MPHKIYIKKITRDYEVKPTIFERYVLWSMKLTEDWLFLFIIGLFLLSITLTMFVILGLFIVFGG